MKNFQKLLLTGVIIAELALLAACHHDNDGAETSGTAPASTDAFTSQVQGVVNGPDAQSETAEPVVVSGITPTTPETTTPISVSTN